MNVRSLILVVGALLIAGIAGLLARNLLMQSAQPAQAAYAPEPKESSTKVLVAARALPTGTIIENEHLTWQAWPDDGVTDAYFVGNTGQESEAVGKVVRHSVLAGQPVARTALVGPGERGFLAAVLATDMRAITVSISDTSGVAGFVFPGDRVDLILTHEVPRDESTTVKIAETVLSNVRVLAVDQDTNDQKNEAKVRRTVTLEVTPKLVEKISVMQRLGSLSLSLRPLADPQLASQVEEMATSDAAALEAAGQTAPAGNETALLRDPSMPWDDEKSYTTGSDVSQFADGMPTRKATTVRRASRAPAPSVTITRGGETSKVPGGR